MKKFEIWIENLNLLIKAVGVDSVKGTILNNDICVHFHKKNKFIKQPLIKELRNFHL